MYKKSLDEIEKEYFLPAPSPFEMTDIPLTPVKNAKLADNGIAFFSLNGRFDMKDGGDEPPDFSDSVPADIPCTVQTALLKAGIIPDPMFGKNDKFAREAAYHTWWFKKEFDYDGSMRRPHLHFDGICHKALFYLNGKYLGTHIGMFGGPDFDVSELLLKNNTLLIKIENSPADPKHYSEYADYDEGWKHGVVVNCVYGWHYACIPTRGIWADVSLTDTPECPFERPFILTENYSECKIGICIKSRGRGKGNIKIKVSPENFCGDDQYFIGEFDCTGGEQLHYTLYIKNGRLWWPNGYGDQPLYRVEISLENSDDMPQHFTEIIGIRQIEMRPIDGELNPKLYNWRFFINGKYVFIKGTNWCTTDALLRCTNERYDRFLELAKHQNLQLLRAWGGGMPESDYFYRKCDELGLMVQQEWPTCWDSPKTQPTEALIETVRINTIRLRNHASLVRWAGGNELSATDEPSIKEMGHIAFELDGTRPFHRTSPYAGSLHNYDTFWLMEEMDNALNLRAPFIGEFGMASSPNYESVARYVPKEELALSVTRDAKNCFQYHTPRFNEFYWPESLNDMDHLLKRAVEFFPVNTIEDFISGTQLAQSVAVRHTLETQRADSPKAAGVCYYKLTDVYPACSWSTIDYYGVPKIPYYVFKDAFAPLHAMLLINSIDASEKYPVILLDDTLALSGKKCFVKITAFNSALECIAENEFKFTADGNVRQVGVFKPENSVRENLLILCIQLYAENMLLDDTFYFQNYRKKTGSLAELPEATLSLKSEGSYAIISNTSSVPAVGVFLENLPHDTQFTAERNFLCILPGESRKISVSHTEGLSVRALNFKRHEVNKNE